MVVGFAVGLFVINPPGEEPTTPAVTRTTFYAYSYEDGEDVSGLVPISLWTPKSTAEFDETADTYTMTNFEESTASARAGSVSVDLSSYANLPIWVETDPGDTTPFANHYFLIYGGINVEYPIPCFDPTTDVNFNMVNAVTMDEVTVAGYQTDGNYTILFDCPHYTTTAAQMHYGTDWDTTTAEFEDMTATQQAWFYDEKNYAGQYPLFDPNTYTHKTTLNYPSLQPLTNGFCFKMAFNESISIIDGDHHQVNFTISDDIGVQPVITGTYIYLIYYEPVSFLTGIQQLDFEITFAVNITLSDIDSGNIPILQSGNSLGTFVKMSDIAA